MIVVYHGILPYERSRHRGMMSAYAERVPLVYVDPDTERDISPARSAKAVAETLRRRPAPGLYPVTLASTLPGGRLRPIARMNRWLALRDLLSRLRKDTGEPVILINQQPGLLPARPGLGALGATATVYEVRDDYVSLALTSAAAEQTQIAHDKLLEQADHVWAISRALVDAAISARPDTKLIGVGVEYAEFAGVDDTAAPGELRILPRPRIGLVGNLNDRVDWRLLEDIARARPQWQLVVIGPVYHSSDAARLGLENLTCLDNAHHIPAVPQEQLGACIAALDVCLIPYRLTQATLRINSLKVYQYLAVGKPVVSTRIPSVLELDDVVDCVEPDRFTEAIEQALSARDAEPTERRRQRAAAFDWRVIVDEQLRLLGRSVEPGHGVGG